jgi:RNA polymerase sigma factor (sigma-70 family)
MRFPTELVTAIQQPQRRLPERVNFHPPFKFAMDSLAFWCSKFIGSAQVHGRDNSSSDDPAHFHTTRWSAIVVAAQSQMPGSRAALSELCVRYWYPLYAFARRRGYASHDAEDVTQGFFLHLLEHKALHQVHPLKGRFRSFLLASFQNYLASESYRARTLKRGGTQGFVFIDAENAESRYRLEPFENLTPEKIFDARWALTILAEAMKRLEEEYSTQQKSAAFETLKGYLATDAGKDSQPYEEAAKKLGISLGAVKTLIHRLRKRYAVLLREAVSRTVSDQSDVEAEIHALCDAIIAAEGRT